MADITKEYAVLFNGVTEILQELENLTRRLKMYQQLAEEAFLEAGDKVGGSEKAESELLV